MKLYSLPLSPFAARVRGAIYAKELPVEIASPPEGWQTSEGYRALNPLRRIPVLVLDDGTSIPESGVIVEYLEDAYPAQSLRPRAPEALARVRLITQVAELYVLPALMPLFSLFDAKTKDLPAIETQLTKLDDSLSKLEPLLTPNALAHPNHLTTADVWLTPLRFSLGGLMSFSTRTTLLDKHPRISGYKDIAQSTPALSRVWTEMTLGLESFYARRSTTPAA